MQSIEKELLERLEKGVYGDIYNYPVEKYNKLLDDMEKDAVEEEEEVVCIKFFLLFISPFLFSGVCWARN